MLTNKKTTRRSARVVWCRGGLLLGPVQACDARGVGLQLMMGQLIPQSVEQLPGLGAAGIPIPQFARLTCEALASNDQCHASTDSPHCSRSQADWAAVVATIGTGARQGRRRTSTYGTAPDVRAAAAHALPSGALQEFRVGKRRGGRPGEGLHRRAVRRWAVGRCNELYPCRQHETHTGTRTSCIGHI